MAEEGAASLSLRAIAARMGVSAPALYNYYKNRDELVTALIVDAYNSLGLALREATKALPTEDYADQFLQTALACREWAITHRVEYTLIFGTPIPGYHAPADVTSPVARQAMTPLGQVLQAAWQAGKLHLPAEYGELPAQVAQQLNEWVQQTGTPVALTVLRLMLVEWAQIQGLISLELYGHFNAFTREPGELYRLEILSHLNRFGLQLAN